MERIPIPSECRAGEVRPGVIMLMTDVFLRRLGRVSPLGLGIIPVMSSDAVSISSPAPYSSLIMAILSVCLPALISATEEHHMLIINCFCTGKSKADCKGKFYPVFGFGENGVEITTNFGQDEFQFKGLEGFAWREK